MGWTWEVLAWRAKRDLVIYSGNSLLQALRCMRTLRREGVGCITLVWRP